ncbi:MAG: gliding motility-associated C-terminal domain-containing protein, partial [Flavobacteriales bacterium]
HTYGEPGTYEITLVVYDENGCPDSMTITIEVLLPSELTVPNVFTPNGDGINDVFTIKNTAIASMHGSIFNRWGRKIYEWDGTDNFWDASGYNAGVYYYIVTAVGVDMKEYELKGYVTVIK